MKFTPRTSTSWINENGYIVSVCKTPEKIYQVTRPSDSRPFAHTPDRDEAIRLIQIDMDESA